MQETTNKIIYFGFKNCYSEDRLRVTLKVFLVKRVLVLSQKYSEMRQRNQDRESKRVYLELKYTLSGRADDSDSCPEFCKPGMWNIMHWVLGSCSLVLLQHHLPGGKDFCHI